MKMNKNNNRIANNLKEKSIDGQTTGLVNLDLDNVIFQDLHR